MNVFVATVFFALGFVVNAIYNYNRKIGEYKAFKNGYAQAQREENIRKDAYESGKFQERYAQYTMNYQPRFVPAVVNNNPNNNVIDSSFMENLHKNGRAVVKIN